MRLSFRGPSLVRRLAGLAILAALSACSDPDNFPECKNCEAWDLLTRGLGRFPEPHPSNPSILVYSSVEKTPGAPDANRTSDEDLWLTWIVDPQADPAANPRWQLTGDELGAGDNFYARWSPTGDALAFVHGSATGPFQVWRVPVTPPSSPGGQPLVGAAEMISAGRDPAWTPDGRLMFTRADKLWAVDLSGGSSARGGSTPVQLTFNPPSYASSDEYIDRHADFSADGGGVFSTLGRVDVADVIVEAFEVDRTVMPPDTVPTDAFVLYQAPGGVAAYPLFQGPDTLRTPAVLRSLPVAGGGVFTVGVRIDGRFDADTTRETYCDTTLTRARQLGIGDVDSLRFHFEIARGHLRIETALGNTTVFWSRADGLVDLADFPQGPLLVDAGQAKLWTCLLAYEVVNGVPNPAVLETFVISATRPGSPRFSTTTTLTPGDTTRVLVYPPAPGTEGAVEGRLLTPMAPASVISSVSGRSRPPDAVAGALSSLLRAPGDLGTVWRLELETDRAVITEILGSSGLIQNPTISRETPAGFRYLAYVSNENGPWDLFVQRLAVEISGSTETWRPDGDPVQVLPPGSPDNLDCRRNVFHPRFVPGSSPGSLALIVAMSDCPDNGFEELGFDDDPWAIGELRLWQVSVELP